ncbi:MAG TPA: DUF3300 domain-containing protein, partial [Thermoanaerobaculia bacterium]|nr:DUF3300 domain-containing protein [Thermoanaerobaculia bacterium]
MQKRKRIQVTALLLVVLVAVVPAVPAQSGGKAAATPAPKAATTPPPAGAASTAPAATKTAAPGTVRTANQGFSKEQLEQLVAPIALYPDSLLVQIMMAATYPLE